MTSTTSGTNPVRRRRRGLVGKAWRLMDVRIRVMSLPLAD